MIPHLASQHPQLYARIAADDQHRRNQGGTWLTLVHDAVAFAANHPRAMSLVGVVVFFIIN
jgi:hypothetical protein